MTKTCNTCNQALPKEAFSRHKGRKDGYLETCKACRNSERKAKYAADEAERERVLASGRRYRTAPENAVKIKAHKHEYFTENREAHYARSREWYYANIDKARAQKSVVVARYFATEKGRETRARYIAANAGRIAAYRADHADHIKANKQARYTLNKEAVLAGQKAYYEANKASILARNKAYQQQNPEPVKRAKRAWAGRNPDASRVKQMRRRARLRQAGGGLVSVGVIRSIWYKQKGLCIYCRAKLGDSPKARAAYHVDHVVPISKGGNNDPKNLQCLCPSCNLRKGAKLPHEFAQQLGRLF